MSDSDKKVLEGFDTVLSFATICTLSKSGNERGNLESMSYRFKKKIELLHYVDFFVPGRMGIN